MILIREISLFEMKEKLQVTGENGVFIHFFGKILDERMLIIDYDNAEFGMRAWDLMYYANAALV